MTSHRFCFDQFTLDVDDRQLRRGDELVELNSRYLDALALLVREQGRLIPKERFLQEVWRGIPVTEEALTQCVKTLRRRLCDDAANPRFIETVPKHGYRFIALVEQVEENSTQRSLTHFPWRQLVQVGLAGTIGGGVAGCVGGLFYGFAGASDPLAPGIGAVSVLLVLLCITVVVGLLGGVGVSFGITAASLARSRAWTIAGGALGGFVIGGIVKLLGIDAFFLLVGRSPGDITGPLEGSLLGGAIGLAVSLASRDGTYPSRRRAVLAAAFAGGVAGIIIVALGGRLMGGSLILLEHSFPASRLRVDRIGAWFGESGFGPVAQFVTAALEGSLFGACLVGALAIARRSLDDDRF